MMRWRHLFRTHFKQLNRNPPLGKLPGSFTAGETGTDNAYSICHDQ